MLFRSLIYFLGENDNDQRVSIEVKNEDGDSVTEINTRGNHGFNTFSWDLVIDDSDDSLEFLQKGTYTITFKTGRASHDVTFEVK